MQKQTKIPAFTLTELVVVILITTVVVALAFSVLQLVQKHMSGIKNNFNTNLELNKLEEVLHLDFNRYHTANYNTINEELMLYSEIDTVSYKFTDTKLVRAKDTFNLQFKEVQFYLNGEKTTSGNIDAIFLQTDPEFLSQDLFIYKRTDASLVLNKQ